MSSLFTSDHIGVTTLSPQLQLWDIAAGRIKRYRGYTDTLALNIARRRAGLHLVTSTSGAGGALPRSSGLPKSPRAVHEVQALVVR